MIVTLQPLEEVTISGRGETVVYLSGSESLLFAAAGKRAEIPSGSQITFPTFDQFTVQNKGESPVNAELLIVEGEFRSLAEGSTVRIQGINDPVEINEVQRIVEAVTANIANTVDIRQITETLTANVVNTVTAQIANTVNTNITNAFEITGPLEAVIANGHGSLWQQLSTIQGQIDGISSQIDAPAASIATSNKAFTAGESFTVPANTNRRDITIFAAETNTDVVTVAGIPLAAGQWIELNNYVGSVEANAVDAGDKITMIEVIK